MSDFSLKRHAVQRRLVRRSRPHLDTSPIVRIAMRATTVAVLIAILHGLPAVDAVRPHSLAQAAATMAASGHAVPRDRWMGLYES